LRAAEGVYDAATLASTIGVLQVRGVEAGFIFAVRPDARDATRYLPQLAQGGLGLPERDYYFRGDERSVAIRDAYRKHVARMLVLAGSSPEKAERESASLLALETRLAQASMTAVERRDPHATYNKTTRAILAADTPEFKWPAYWLSIGGLGY